MRKCLLLILTVGLLLSYLTVGLASCTHTDPATQTSNTSANTQELTMEDTTVTEYVTEGELFSPDPERAVPEYDTLMSNLDTFPLYFKYGTTEYNGFEGFVLESENYENVDRGVKSTLVLRHPEIPASFKLVATVYPQESAYEYVVYITNDGQENTEIFSDLSFQIEFVGENPLISGIKGDAGGQFDCSWRRHAEQRTPG